MMLLPVNLSCIALLCLLSTSDKLLNIWDNVFKNGPSKICGRVPLRQSA